MPENDVLRKRVGRAVSAWMEHARLSPTDLEKRTGIARGTIYAAKNGTRVPTVEVLDRIGIETGTTASRLIDGVMPPKAMVASEAAAPESRLAYLESVVAIVRENLEASAREASIRPSGSDASTEDSLLLQLAQRVADLEKQAVQFEKLVEHVESGAQDFESLLDLLESRLTRKSGQPSVRAALEGTRKRRQRDSL